MHLIIHDLSPEDFAMLFPATLKDTTVVSDNGTIKECMGCFGCWVKTPGQCVITDDYQHMGALLGKTESLTIISRCCFGGCSPFVKNVLDRSISYILPYFEIRHGEMHHKPRYDNLIHIRLYYYGDSITENEKNTAKELAVANAVNFNGILDSIKFADNLSALKEVFSC